MYYWIYSLCGGLLFFQGISLLVRKVNLNFKFLGIFFLLYAYLLLTTYWNISGLLLNMPHLYKTGAFFGYLAGPVFYFFLHFTFYRDSGLRPRHTIHLIPFLLHFIELLPFFLLSAEEKRMEFIAHQYQNYMNVPWGYFTKGQHLILKSTITIFYALAGLYQNWKVIQKLEKSDIRQTRLFGLWLKWSGILLVITMALVSVVYSLNWLFQEQANTLVHGTFFMSGVFCVLFFAFFPELTGWPLETPTQRMAMESLNDDIARLSKQDVSSIQFSDLLTTMLEKYHTDENLDVGQMARLMHLSERNLYRKIKETHNTSPSEVLNALRLQKAHATIQEYPFKSIEEIAKESGFKTKRSFSKRFKDHFGLLPGDFQQVCRGNTSEVQ